MARRDKINLDEIFAQFTPQQWEMRKLALSSLYNFSKYVLGYDKMDDDVHKEWETWIDHSVGIGKIKLMLMPRGHFKSTFFTVSAPIWLLLQDQEKRILILNARWDNARSFLFEITQQLKNNPMLHWLFPETLAWLELSDRWTADSITLPRKTAKKEPSIMTSGVGAHLVSQHFDLIIGDDLVDNENTMTKDQLDKTINFWKQSLSLLEVYGESDYWLIGTRWHDGDLYGYLLKHIPEELHVIKRQAILEDGTPYFPSMFSLEALQKIRKAQGTYIFSCQYMNEPVDEEDAIFRREWVRYAPHAVKMYQQDGWWKAFIVVHNKLMPGGYEEREIQIYAGIDPAIGERDYNDYTAIAVIGIDQITGMVYLIDLVYDRLNPKGQIDALFAINKKWHPICIAVETIAYQKALKFWADNFSIKEHIYAPFVETKSDWNKMRRIQMMQPLWEAGGVEVLESCPHQSDFEYEMFRFPKGEHDDILDALEMCFRQAGILYREPAPQEQNLTEIERRIQERMNPNYKKPSAFVDTHLGTEY